MFVLESDGLNCAHVCEGATAELGQRSVVGAGAFREDHEGRKLALSLNQFGTAEQSFQSVLEGRRLSCARHKESTDFFSDTSQYRYLEDEFTSDETNVAIEDMTHSLDVKAATVRRDDLWCTIWKLVVAVVRSEVVAIIHIIVCQNCVLDIDVHDL